MNRGTTFGFLRRLWSTTRWASCHSAFAVLLLGVSIAGELAAEMPQSAMELLHIQTFDWSDRRDRVALAKDLGERVDELLERIPSQKPEERARLAKREARLKTEDPQALSRLYLSAAFQHLSLEQQLDGVLTGLACVRNSEQVAVEMQCWSRVSIGLLQEDKLRVALQTLRRSRRMAPRREEPLFQKDPQLWFSQFGLGVVVHILEPYLSARAQSLLDVSAAR
ncbi:MAG: hypothetical protein AAF918_06085 [Pseudomonadota bacterium]